MGSFLEIMAPISMMITAVLLLVQNIIEERAEKKEAEFEEIKKRWKEAEENL